MLQMHMPVIDGRETQLSIIIIIITCSYMALYKEPSALQYNNKKEKKTEIILTNS